MKKVLIIGFIKDGTFSGDLVTEGKIEPRTSGKGTKYFVGIAKQTVELTDEEKKLGLKAGIVHSPVGISERTFELNGLAKDLKDGNFKGILMPESEFVFL